MDGGFFPVLAEALASVLGDGGLVLLAVVGFVGVSVLVCVMPARIMWVAFRHFFPIPGRGRWPGHYAIAWVMLSLSVYLSLEILLSLSGNGGSGIMVMIFSIIPFMFYLGFEFFYGHAISRRLPDERDDNQGQATDK